MLIIFACDSLSSGFSVDFANKSTKDRQSTQVDESPRRPKTSMTAEAQEQYMRNLFQLQRFPMVVFLMKMNACEAGS